MWVYHKQGGVTVSSITYIGMDVHTTNYTISAFQIEGEKVWRAYVLSVNNAPSWLER